MVEYLTKIVISSIGVAALGFSSTEALILILEKVLNCRYGLIVGPILLPSQVFFFHVEEQKVVRWCQIRRIWRMVNQFKATVVHTQQPLQTTDLCAGALSWWNRTLSVSFPGRLRNVSIVLFSKSWITYPVWVYLEGNNAVSTGKVEFNACQVLLLWHNSSLSAYMNFSARPRISKPFNTSMYVTQCSSICSKAYFTAGYLLRDSSSLLELTELN